MNVQLTKMCYPNYKNNTDNSWYLQQSEQNRSKEKNRNRLQKNVEIRPRQQLICLMNKTVKKMNINNNINNWL